MAGLAGIRTKNSEFIQSGLVSAVENAKRDPGVALFLLGQALHTQQDIVRHRYFSFLTHFGLTWPPNKNIKADERPPLEELIEAFGGSTKLIGQFEKMVRGKYGKESDQILSRLKSYSSKRKSKDKNRKKFRRWVAEDVWQDTNGNFHLR